MSLFTQSWCLAPIGVMSTISPSISSTRASSWKSPRQPISSHSPRLNMCLGSTDALDEAVAVMEWGERLVERQAVPERPGRRGRAREDEP